MQIQSLRIKSYRSWRINDTASSDAICRLRKLKLYALLASEGCSPASGGCTAIANRAGLESRSRRPGRTRKRQGTKPQAQTVYHLRQRYPLWGKRTLWKIVVREQHLDVSDSTVGRILSALMATGQVKAACFYCGRLKPRRRRQCTHHARRWQYGMKARAAGELMQIDHRQAWECRQALA